MREVSFVKRLKFDFDGNITKRALVIGDADNDNQNELVCANLQGDLAVFKGRHPNRYAAADNLGMVTACAVGDLINSAKNFVAAINMEGWLSIFELRPNAAPGSPTTDGPSTAGALNDDPDLAPAADPAQSRLAGRLTSIYQQRMPANCKELLSADLDGDGQNELIISLTDRVLRTYKWIKTGPEQGKFVGLYKWEFADQIGSVSLNPSQHENCKDIVVAQPGGTYAKLECFDKNLISTGAKSDQPETDAGAVGDGDEVGTDYVNKLTPEYHQLALSQMRNHQVSTEVLGNIHDGKGSKRCDLMVIATLDGTLMLVSKDEILWSLQVDHQLFALAVLEVDKPDKPRPLFQSESGGTIAQESSVRDAKHRSQYFVACAWNGKTYIIDEERNYLRFKFDEAVSAFTAGEYYFDDGHHACLVYATFNNQIVLYYDVLVDNIRSMYLLDEILHNAEHEDLLGNLHELVAKLKLADSFDELGHARQTPGDAVRECERKVLELHRTVSEILYNLSDEDVATFAP